MSRKASELPDPSSDEFAYLVAVHAWREGLTANAIAKKLGLPSDPRYLMQVKRALKRAHGHFLKLVPVLSEHLRDKLAARFSGTRREIRFYVVDDRRGPASVHVYAKAAELVSEMILDAVQRTSELGRHNTDDPAGQVVISNAGGRTLSETVKALLRNPPLLDESEEKAKQLSDRLLFVAANGAYHPDQFQRSANFLSVTMAELFGSRHMAFPIVGPDKSQQDDEVVDEHRNYVENAALFVCGAGSRDSGLLTQYFRKRPWVIPQEAVGDLAFNLLDKDGRSVEPTTEGREFLKQFNRVDLVTLRDIARANRVLLILASEEPEQKRQIATAVLRREYATDVVLGARLASAILSG